MGKSTSPLLLVGAVIWAGATFGKAEVRAAGSSPPTTVSAQRLPEGQGKATVERVCAGCHEVGVTTSGRETEEGWAAIVNDMRSRGANGSEEEFDEIIVYLARFFRRNASPAPAPTPSAPPDEPRTPAGDAPRASHARMELVSERTKVAPGEGMTLGLRVALDEGWRMSGKDAGASAPQVTWTAPKELSLGDIQWPAPERLARAGQATSGYEEQVLLLVPANVLASASLGSTLDVRARLSYQVCKDTCVMETAIASMMLPVGTGGVPDKAEEFRRARARVLQPNQ